MHYGMLLAHALIHIRVHVLRGIHMHVHGAHHMHMLIENGCIEAGGYRRRKSSHPMCTYLRIDVPTHIPMHAHEVMHSVRYTE